MDLMKTGLTLRGDFYYCPLALTLSTYWNCEPHCSHCWLRRLNRTWGEDLRPLDTEGLARQVHNGINNMNPKTNLGRAIQLRKTVYLGAKSDPYQMAEIQYQSTRESLRILFHYGFSVVIATMFTENLERDMDLFTKYKSQVIFMPIVSPGIDRDWEVLERKQTTQASSRINTIAKYKKQGYKVGVNGEPFISGYHTISDFSNILDLLKSKGLESYNIYNLHLNDWNAKEMNSIGLDIEAIWEGNKDENWRPTLMKLIEIAREKGIKLGCPDFINSGQYIQPTNTCCGIDVPNPLNFNLIRWKDLKCMGKDDKMILDSTWEGIGDRKEGWKLITGKADKKLFSLKDIKE